MAKVPVIVVLPRQESLLESASLAREGKVKLDVGNIRSIPQGVEILEGLPAISAGTTETKTMALESLNPDASEVFAVRGRVEEDLLDGLRGRQEGGAEVQADPIRALKNRSTFSACYWNISSAGLFAEK